MHDAEQNGHALAVRKLVGRVHERVPAFGQDRPPPNTPARVAQRNATRNWLYRVLERENLLIRQANHTAQQPILGTELLDGFVAHVLDEMARLAVIQNS
ncbi:hypothetical protein HK101_004471, partial [Irineochytrium annulatum]